MSREFFEIGGYFADRENGPAAIRFRRGEPFDGTGTQEDDGSVAPVGSA